MSLQYVEKDGVISFRSITRANLPEGDVPPNGRELTQEQINDALHLIACGLSGRMVKADVKKLAREAAAHLCGHMCWLENLRRAQPKALVVEPPPDWTGEVFYLHHGRLSSYEGGQPLAVLDPELRTAILHLVRGT